VKNCIFFLSIFFSMTSATAKESIKNKNDLRTVLTPMQYKVTQEGGTEPAFKNEYWNNKSPGIYVDVTTGEALFSSLDKYDSETGWPSFTKGINEKNVKTKVDFNLLQASTEVRCKNSDIHLGHVFDDGPADKGGKRFCINSSALRFVPLEEMQKQGYGQYLPQFSGASGHK
jgi:methionine-R-sulfoxide reductase